MASNIEDNFQEPKEKTPEDDKIKSTSMTEASQVKDSSKTFLPQPLTDIKPPDNIYFIDQIKNGILISKKIIDNNCVIIGRARDCDIIMDHPSISRYHAALLWSPKNDEDYKNGSNLESFWYLIDCDSTHGTICNKQKVLPRKTIKITPNNNLFRFGASTRVFCLGSNIQTDDDDDDNDQDNNTNKNKELIDEEDPDACTWGMSLTDCNDETEENDDSGTLKSIIEAIKDGQSNLPSENENTFVDNPIKALQQWFEREGFDFDYTVDSVDNKFKCTFELPLNGDCARVEGQLTKKKKDSLADACLKCCKILDHAGLLFVWQRNNKKKAKNIDEFYDNDDDLIDETVKIKKKLKKNTVENYDTLNSKWLEVNKELGTLKARLATIGLEPGVTPEIPEGLTDSLDLFYATMNQKKYGLRMNEKVEKSKLRMQIKELEREQTRIEKLIQIAKPADIVLKKS